MLERGKYPGEGVFEGVNIMTPEVLEYGTVSPGVWYELSKGRGIYRERIYGVTIRDTQGEKRQGHMFHSFNSALEFLQELSEGGG